MRQRLALVLARFLASHTCASQIVLQGQQLEVQLDPAAAYTVHHATWNGVVFVDQAAGSCQGTVLGLGDGALIQWAGSCHGNETVLSVVLLVDGITVPAVAGTYAGTTFELRKTSELSAVSQVVRLEAVTYFTADEILERARLETLTAGTVISPCYGWISSHANVLTDYYGYRLTGALISGATDADGNLTTTLPALAKIAQADPLSGFTVATLFDRQSSGDLTLIWDRVTDNKLYWRNLAFTNPVPIGTVLRHQTLRRIGVGEPLTLLDSLNGEHDSDTDADGDVDESDMQAVLAALEGLAGALPSQIVAADADQDWDVDIEDFAALQRRFGAGR